MTHPVLQAIYKGDDEAKSLVLALMEKLAERTQNYGAVRACEPLLRKEDMEAIMKRAPVLAESLEKARAGANESGLVLPPGAM